MARGAALVILGGLAAGCSSDVSRFQDSILTGSSRGQAQAAPGMQPYPGDTASGLDQTHTGSVTAAPRRQGILNRAGLFPTPRENVGGGTQLASSAGQMATQQPRYAAPSGAVSGAALAPVARSQLDGTVTGSTQPVQQAQSIQQPQPVRQARASGEGGWSAQGGSQVTVRQGETIAALSSRYNVPESALRQANGLSGNQSLAAGSTIIIPTFSQPGAPADRQPVPQQTPNQVAVLPQQPSLQEREAAGTSNSGNTANSNAAPSAGSTYTVVAGDTLSAISRRTGVSTEALKSANGLSSGLIRIGQTLTIPGAGQQASTTQIAENRQSAPANVDPIVTGGSSTPPSNGGRETASSYTPPVTAGRQIDVASIDPGQAAPDATGVGMRWPARGRVITAFGATSGGSPSDGIDIAVPEGTSIRAAENGVVIYAGDGLREFGNTVLIRHEDGLVTVYGHASKINVSRGDTVRRGQEIALSGMSGSADSPRLHFEVRKDSTPVDPMTFLE